GPAPVSRRLFAVRPVRAHGLRADRESRHGPMGYRPRCDQGHRSCRAGEPRDGRARALVVDLPRAGFSRSRDRLCRAAGHAADQVGHDGVDHALENRSMTDERYPIGKFTPVPSLSPADRNACIEQIAAAPTNFRRAVAGLNDAQLDTPYRNGGWTVRQVAHHVPDSHMNAYIRFKLGLTEDAPAIKTYDEKDWAKTPETRAPIAMSLDLLTALHVRWVALLRGMRAADLARTIK